MKKLMLGLGLAVPAFCQLYSTAETVGKNNSVLLVTPNLVSASGSAAGEANLALVFHGLTDRLDLMGGLGSFTTSGRTQVSAIVGFTATVYKSDRFSLGVYNLLNTGLNNRSQSATAWWYSAFIASKNFKHGDKTFTPYLALAPIVPIGRTRNKLFTYDQPQYNIPIGLAIAKGRWTVQLEYDAPLQPVASSPRVKMAGLGINYMFSGGN